jgi:hypothetical protein
MATGSWNSLHLPSCRTWLISGLERVRRITKATFAHRTKGLQRRILLSIGFVFFVVASFLCRTVLMLGVAAVLALILQGLADPSTLFWAAPWEAVGVVFSRNVRLNHSWFHRTQDLLQEGSVCSSKLDGFATLDGFVLMGEGLSDAEVRWASELAWRLKSEQWEAKKPAGGCKTMRFLFALWLIAGGLIAVSVWHGKVELASTVLVAAVSGAIGHALAGPAERFLSPWVALIAFCDGKTYLYRLEMECFSSPHFLWFKGNRGFQVRRVELEVTPSGART